MIDHWRCIEGNLKCYYFALQYSTLSSIQGFESYDGTVQSVKRMFQTSSGIMQAFCGGLQSYNGVLQPSCGILQGYCEAAARLWLPI